MYMVKVMVCFRFSRFSVHRFVVTLKYGSLVCLNVYCFICTSLVLLVSFVCLVDRSSRNDVSLYLSVSRSNFFFRMLFALLRAVLFSRNVNIVIAQIIVRNMIKVVVVGDEVSILELFSGLEVFVCRGH